MTGEPTVLRFSSGLTGCHIVELVVLADDEEQSATIKIQRHPPTAKISRPLPRDLPDDYRKALREWLNE